MNFFRARVNLSSIYDKKRKDVYDFILVSLLLTLNRFYTYIVLVFSNVNFEHILHLSSVSNVDMEQVNVSWVAES